MSLFPYFALFALCCTSAEAAVVYVEIENLSQSPRWLGTASHPFGRPSEAPTAYPLVYAFHQGDAIDPFDPGEHASDGLAALAKEGIVAELIDEWRTAEPGAVVNMITNAPFGYDDPILRAEFRIRSQQLDPVAHRFFSFAAKLMPSDDAFVASQDPRQIEIFDQSGAFLGPIVIDVYGTDVWDAGVRENREVDVLGLAGRSVDLSAGTPSDEPISRHTGYRGSLGNPDGNPGILGQSSLSPICASPEARSSCFALDPEVGDFTRPGFKLARIRIHAGVGPQFNGFWYDPQRSGEGLNLAIFDGAPARMGVALYTFGAGDEAQQLWLVGTAPAERNGGTVVLQVAEGGEFGSTGNPANVTRSDWGTANIRFDGCHAGFVSMQPLRGDVPAIAYEVQRATPIPPSQHALCGIFPVGYDGLVDDTWPGLGDFIEPDGVE